MDFWQVIEGRHSYRDFRSQPVPRETVEKILRGAAAAPSAANEQPWRFHVATGNARAEIGQLVAQATVHLIEYMDVLGPSRYEDAVHWYSSLGDAPVLIGISMPKPASDMDATNKLLSVGAALENLLLCATAEGLATCNVTFALWVRDELAEAFQIGEDRVIVTLVALGLPSDTPPAAPARGELAVEWLD